jgi:uncharacterized protein (DUF302 family)
MNKLRLVLSLLSLFALQPVLAVESADPLAYTEVKLQIAKIKVQDSVSFDDAIESLKLRANQHNLKFVGSNLIYKEIAALTGKPSRRMEIYNFCDGLTANKLLNADPQMIAFMPCRIALIEDVNGARWVISMMMDIKMIQAMPADTRDSALQVMNSMKDMMVAASRGDL